jgi:anaerobic selenocysteine-containing dehydrogenase
MIELAPSPSWPTWSRLRAPRPRRDDDGLVLIGRRHLRSNNSWMHNVEVLVKGKDRCTLHVHPDDAGALGLVDGEPGRGRVAGRSGRSRSPVEVTDAIRCPAW